MNNSVPQLPTWLKETVLDFYNEMPRGVAELKFSPNNSSKCFSVEILPISKKASSISIAAEEGDWEATIAFGKISQIDARYYDEPDAEAKFKKRVVDICKAITESRWEERIVMRGDRVVRCLATLPAPVGPARITNWRPFSFPSMRKEEETVIQWEQYLGGFKFQVQRVNEGAIAHRLPGASQSRDIFVGAC